MNPNYEHFFCLRCNHRFFGNVVANNPKDFLSIHKDWPLAPKVLGHFFVNHELVEAFCSAFKAQRFEAVPRPAWPKLNRGFDFTPVQESLPRVGIGIPAVR